MSWLCKRNSHYISNYVCVEVDKPPRVINVLGLSLHLVTRFNLIEKVSDASGKVYISAGLCGDHRSTVHLWISELGLLELKNSDHDDETTPDVSRTHSSLNLQVRLRIWFMALFSERRLIITLAVLIALIGIKMTWPLFFHQNTFYAKE